VRGARRGEEGRGRNAKQRERTEIAENEIVIKKMTDKFRIRK
jgi:hypothetical protein